MTKLGVYTLAVLGILGVSTAACTTTTQGTGPGNAESALDPFRNPTGTFDERSSAAAFSGYRSERTESSEVAAPSAAGGGGTRTQSLRLLTTTLDASARCAAGQACACEGGGSFVYEQGSTADGTTLNMTFDGCVGKDGDAAFDGTAYLLITTKSLVGITDDKTAASAPSNPAPSNPQEGSAPTQSPEANSDASAKNFLLVAKGTAKKGGKSIPLEFALVHEGSYTLLAVQVPDGKVVVGVSSTDGTVIVKAKQGSFICTPTSAKGYRCSSKETGKELSVESDTPIASGEGEAPATTAGSENDETGAPTSRYAGEEPSDDWGDEGE